MKDERSRIVAGNNHIIANWQTAETDLFTIGAVGQAIKIHSLIVGIQNLVGNISIRLYTLVDGVERCIFPIPNITTFTVVIDQPAIPVIDSTFGIRNALRVTIESDNALDNGAEVSYQYLGERM